MSRRPPRTLVVIPTYDERANLAEVVGRALAQPCAVDVLVVDDNSPDGTGALADELAARHERMSVLHRPAKTGLGSAYRAGFEHGLSLGYEVLVEMDADLSHDPDDLCRLIAGLDHADVVLGSRYVQGGGVANWPRHRRLLSAGGNRYVRAVTGIPVRDATAGFRAYRRTVLLKIGVLDMRSDGYSFQLEAILACWRHGFVVAEEPILFSERTQGASKISRRIILEALWRVLLWGLRGPRRPAGIHPASVAAAPSVDG